MKINMRFLLFVLTIILLANVASAYNPYGEVYTYEVYYNGEILPGIEVAKPVLKIDEPFSVAVELQVYQHCKVYSEISELGSGNYIVVDGPSDLGVLHEKVFMPNETYKFEWTLKPTDKWTDGSMPLNFYYEIFVPDEYESIVNSEFTIAVPYITNEHYEGQSLSSDPTNTNEPQSSPAFTLLVSLLATVLAARRI